MRPPIQIIVHPAGRDCFRAMLGDRVLAYRTNLYKQQRGCCQLRGWTQLRR
jgi:hypothetical protein